MKLSRRNLLKATIAMIAAPRRPQMLTTSMDVQRDVIYVHSGEIISIGPGSIMIVPHSWTVKRMAG